MGLLDKPNGYEFISGSHVWGLDALYDTSVHIIGNKSVKFVNTGGCWLREQAYNPILPSRTYQVRAWVRSSSTTSTHKPSVGIEFYDASYSLVHTTALETVAAAINTWEHRATEILVGSTARYARMNYGKTTGAFSCWVNEASFVRMPDSFRAYGSSAQNLATGVATKVTFEVTTTSGFTYEQHDCGGLYNTGSSRFTARHAGVYHFGARVAVDLVAGAAPWIALYINGVARAYGTHDSNLASSGYKSLHVHEDVFLARNDYVEVFVYHNSGVAAGVLKGSADCYFYGHDLTPQ